MLHRHVSIVALKGQTTREECVLMIMIAILSYEDEDEDEDK